MALTLFSPPKAHTLTGPGAESPDRQAGYQHSLTEASGPQDTSLIPIKIDGLDSTDLGREAGLSLKDPELVDLVLLLPAKMREQVDNL